MSIHTPAGALPPLDFSGRTSGCWMRDSLGYTILVHHPHSAFPDGFLSQVGIRRRVPVERRIKGRVVHRTELQTIAEPAAFRDNRVLVFVPSTYSPKDPIRLIVFFHGWRGNLRGPTPVTEEMHIRSILSAASGNPVLVVPQGPVDVPSSSFGRLEWVSGLTEFLEDLRTLLPPLPMEPSPGKRFAEAASIELAGHSGGGNPIRLLLLDGADRALDHGGMTSDAEKRIWNRINTVLLFDATYDGLGDFRAWWMARSGRVIKSYYLKGTSTAPVSEGLYDLCRQYPQRSDQLDIEGIRPDSLPMEAQETIHHDMLIMRLARGLATGPAGVDSGS